MSRVERRSNPRESSPDEFVDDYVEPTRVVGGRKKLGRYELVYELGSGGMANVYLARTRGPAGFHKFFAIKRIHPHLEKDQQFVDMFLDEARIAVAVHHPNVAQVFDLGEQEGTHFIAMEYLHGEHLGALSVRAVNEFGRVPFALAARIVSAAADGLHHAHEARNSSGMPLGLVHRDVSPQNVFITYDGQVKLTDFGIAKAADRITHTRTGGLKGKVSYMAPEQALGQKVDRRADIFALGIVLWEMTVGQRLFTAKTDAQTLMRITSGRVRKPSSVVPHYPPELEQIVMRALATQPKSRYPTAAAMARDLDRWIAVTGQPAGAAELGSLMTRLFQDRIAAKEQLLHSGEASALALPVRGVGGDSAVGALPVEPSQSEVILKRPTIPKKHTRSLLVLGLAIVALGVVGTVTWLIGSHRGSVVRIDSAPSGARVILDGEEQSGTTPVLLENVAEGRHELDLELSGFQTLEATFDLEEDRTDLAYRFIEEDTAGVDSPAATRLEVEVEAHPEGDEAGARASESEAVASSPSAEPERRAPSVVRATEGRGMRAVASSAYLNLITRPWATVSIDGRVVGSTPLARQPIPSGRVRIQLRREGTGPPRALVIRASPGETVSRSLDL